LALAVLPAEPRAAITPSWRCITKICLGQSRASLDYRFGTVAADIPSRHISVRGGNIWACFWRCTNAVTEDGFTHYGGTLRPADRLLSVSTCNRLFRLPDGTTMGTPIPFGSKWRGYRRITMEGGVFGWEKRVHFKTQTVVVTVSTTRGRARCVYLERG
jgi:hypothetical protein